jgi:hypothetical protein
MSIFTSPILFPKDTGMSAGRHTVILDSRSTLADAASGMERVSALGGRQCHLNVLVEGYMLSRVKLILRWHRAGHNAVAAQIRGVIPWFRNVPDAGILAASFKLGAAQEMVAGQGGNVSKRLF